MKIFGIIICLLVCAGMCQFIFNTTSNIDSINVDQESQQEQLTGAQKDAALRVKAMIASEKAYDDAYARNERIQEYEALVKEIGDGIVDILVSPFDLAIDLCDNTIELTEELEDILADF